MRQFKPSKLLFPHTFPEAPYISPQHDAVCHGLWLYQTSTVHSLSVCQYLSLCLRVCGLGQTASDTLMWLKTYGTAVDNTSLVSSMLSQGQTVVLTGVLTTTDGSSYRYIK